MKRCVMIVNDTTYSQFDIYLFGIMYRNSAKNYSHLISNKNMNLCDISIAIDGADKTILKNG